MCARAARARARSDTGDTPRSSTPLKPLSLLPCLPAMNYNAVPTIAQPQPQYYPVPQSQPYSGQQFGQQPVYGGNTVVHVGPPMEEDESCARCGCIFSFIPLVGWVSFCVNQNAPEGSRKKQLAKTACYIASLSGRAAVPPSFHHWHSLHTPRAHSPTGKRRFFAKYHPHPTSFYKKSSLKQSRKCHPPPPHCANTNTRWGREATALIRST